MNARFLRVSRETLDQASAGALSPRPAPDGKHESSRTTCAAAILAVPDVAWRFGASGSAPPIVLADGG